MMCAARVSRSTPIQQKFRQLRASNQEVLEREHVAPEMPCCRLGMSSVLSNMKGAQMSHEMSQISAHEDFKEKLDSWKNKQAEEPQRCKAEGRPM